jgi:hypothetical protein
VLDVEGERTRPSTGISFSRTSGWAPRASRSVGSTAEQDLVSRLRVQAGLRGQLGGRAAHRLEVGRPVLAPKAIAASRSASSGASRCAPMRWNSSSSASQIGSSTTQVCSAGQITEASKVFEIRMSTTALRTSAVRCRYTGALPGPTLITGFPAWLESSTMRGTAGGPDQVDLVGWRNRAWVTSSAASGITWSASGGIPARLARLARISTALWAQRTACGEGRNTIALRVLAATMPLNSAVEVGLVTGGSPSRRPPARPRSGGCARAPRGSRRRSSCPAGSRRGTRSPRSS